MKLICFRISKSHSSRWRLHATYFVRPRRYSWHDRPSDAASRAAIESVGPLFVCLDEQTMRVHHTEYTMPASGMLFANDHDAGRTFIFDLRNPLYPKTVTSFADMGGYMHPHSYLRLPNGHVLATFQHAHRGEGDGQNGATVGVGEIDDQGKVVRSASNADPAFADALLMPYSLVVLPDVDRIVLTNSSMHSEDIF